MRQSTAFQLRNFPGDAIATSRRLLCMLMAALCFTLVQSFAVQAQTSAPTPLPPAAQEALDNGIIAARVPDYLLAIRYFEEARKLAPHAPVVFLNMGLAESRIPGRELRAIAWFGAYMAAYPDAPNAAAVKEQINVLEVRNRSNVLRLIKTVQDAANQISDRDVADQKSGDTKEGMILGKSPRSVYQLPHLWVKAGDIASAQKAADLIRVADDISLKSEAQWVIAKAQIQAGDIAGALKTANLIQYPFWKNATQKAIAQAQLAVAQAQAMAGDVVGAQKTADLIQNAEYRDAALSFITKTKTRAANSEQQSTAGTQPIQPVIPISDWLNKLDDDNKRNKCPLNTNRFLDLAGYLKSLPPPDYPASPIFVRGPAGRTLILPLSGDPRRVLESLYETVEKLLDAQNVISGMLKQQAKR